MLNAVIASPCADAPVNAPASVAGVSVPASQTMAGGSSVTLLTAHTPASTVVTLGATSDCGSTERCNVCAGQTIAANADTDTKTTYPFKITCTLPAMKTYKSYTVDVVVGGVKAEGPSVEYKRPSIQLSVASLPASGGSVTVTGKQA